MKKPGPSKKRLRANGETIRLPLKKLAALAIEASQEEIFTLCRFQKDSQKLPPSKKST